jgi:hypothetical protein
MAKSTKSKSVSTSTDSGSAKLKLLGRSETRLPSSVSSSTLETFENRYPHRDYVIEFDADDLRLCTSNTLPTCIASRRSRLSSIWRAFETAQPSTKRLRTASLTTS